MTKLHFTAMPHAQETLDQLRARYGDAGPKDADIVVALGGDGFMLQTLARLHRQGQADLRHEPRYRRLPDERISHRAICSNGWPPPNGR